DGIRAFHVTGVQTCALPISTVTVAAMFVLAAGLQNSGALSGIGNLLARAKSPLQFLITLFIVLAVIAPFVNNTAVVAVFMPIVRSEERRGGTACERRGRTLQ